VHVMGQSGEIPHAGNGKPDAKHAEDEVMGPFRIHLEQQRPDEQFVHIGGEDKMLVSGMYLV
jgi:hypothetical protein